jgi:hypothetical protein
MPTYLFQAKLIADQQGQPVPLPPGCVARFALLMPGGNGAFTREQLVAYARQFGLGSQGIAYGITEINHAQLTAPVVVTEISLGNGMSPQAAPVQMSGEHIRGGQPVGGPTPQGGVPRTDAPRDRLGFQKIGDDGLDGGVDSVYGDTGDYTVSDLVIDGGGVAREVRRQG